MSKFRINGTQPGRVNGLNIVGADSALTVNSAGELELDLSAAVAAILAAGPITTTYLILTDGVTAPSATSGKAKVYVDTADGDMKVKYGDANVGVIVDDT